MIEHEKKFSIGSFDTIIPALKALGFKESGKSYQKDTYFSRSDVDFMETRECLRIRVEDKGTEITYKPPTTKAMHDSHAIWKKETNLAVTNEQTARDLLLAIGSKELCTVEKRRVEYKKDSVTVALDKVTDAGQFVEIEILSDEHDKNANERINQLADSLGLSSSDVVTRPYRDLVMDATALADS